MNDIRPLMAIVCANSLTVMGLKQLLQGVMPSMEIETYASVEALRDGQPDRFFHFFVDISAFLTDRQFFTDRQRRTIVLTTSPDHSAQLAGFHCLCVNVDEKDMVRSLLMLMRHGHRGRPMPPTRSRNVLSAREVEVLALVAQGLLNKEIADRLNISLTTVITHRKNIVEKLGLRSVSALTIHAVMNCYVDLDKI